MKMKVHEIAVIGSGTMGSQIAMVCALSGYPVTLQDVSEESLAKAKDFLQQQMDKRVKKGRYTAEETDAAFSRILFTSSLADVRDADLVIEAIVEKLDVKRELFRQLDDLTQPHAILATNSSTIVSSKLADATNRPEKVCNIHFFNPALVMELVEVVKGPHTSEETANTAMEFVKTIKKTPVLLKKRFLVL